MVAAAKKKATLRVDMTQPREKRPLTGYDIHQWASENGLPKYDACHALGFRNTNHYNDECKQPLLDFELELLIRIYMAYPGERSWRRYSLPELFQEMYGRSLEPFKDTEHEKFAKVDLGGRFVRLFGKSESRQYDWLWLKPKSAKTPRPDSTVDAILSKLMNVPHPGHVLEEISKLCHKLRGVDLDQECPIPTLSNPPQREKTGRRPTLPATTGRGGKVSAPRKSISKAPKRAAKVAPRAAKKSPTRVRARAAASETAGRRSS
jgi:hypothetical protein